MPNPHHRNSGNRNDPVTKVIAKLNNDVYVGREEEINHFDSIVNGITFARKKSQQPSVDATDGISSSSSSLVVLHGVAGSGKSRFIEQYFEMRREGRTQHQQHQRPFSSSAEENNDNNVVPWLLAKGKFEQHRRSEPYSAIIEALNDLVEQWSVWNNTQAVICQMNGFHSLLEEDINFLYNIIPKAFETHGRCKSTKMKISKTMNNKTTDEARTIDFSSIESVNAAFTRILTFLCQARPVCLFLDDIHWADRSSLGVIKSLLMMSTTSRDGNGGASSAIDGLLVVVSYGDEEVSKSLSLSILLDDIQEEESSNENVHNALMQNLTVDDVAKIVTSINDGRDYGRDDEIQALAKVIHSKTAGNPFFVIQFVQMLIEEQFIKYSYTEFRWEVTHGGNAETLQNFAKISDNVADMISAKFSKLPYQTQIVLKVASCLGKVIPVDVLQHYFTEFEEIGNHTDDETWFPDRQTFVGHTYCPMVKQRIENNIVELRMILQSAVEYGILLRYNNNRNNSHTQSDREQQEVEEEVEELDYTFVWSNDKLQNVIHNLIPESMRPALHLSVGKVLWKMSSDFPEEEWMVFMAADQFNKGTSEGNCPTCLGRSAAELNLHAAKLSLSKSALFPALDMLRACVRNLAVNPNRWINNYEFCLEVYNLLAEVCVRLGQYDDATDIVTKEIEVNAKSLDDKFRGQCVMLKCITSGSNRDYKLGTSKALEVLRYYGVKLPTKLLPGQLFLENQKLKKKLPGGKLQGIMNLTDMTDERSKKITQLLVRHLAMYAWLQGTKNSQPLAALAMLRALAIACEKGMSSDLPFCVCWFATLLVKDGHYEEAVEYGEFAIKLAEKVPQEIGSYYGTVVSLTNSGIFPSLRPFHATLEGLLEGYRCGLKSGEIEKALIGILSYSLQYLCVGLPLGPLESDLIAFGRDATQLNAPYTVRIMFPMIRQAVLNLQNEHSGNSNQDDENDRTVLKGAAMDQAAVMKNVEGFGSKMTLRDINTLRLMLACMYNDWDTAEKMLDFLEPYMSHDSFIARYHLRLTYMGLASLVLSHKSGGKKTKYRNIAKKVIKIFKTEVKRGSVNAHPVLVMLEAEESPSKKGYENAIKICARLGLVHHGAYLCEQAGLYFLKAGPEQDKGWGQFYLAQSCMLYEDWDALGKVQAMHEEYGELLEAAEQKNGSSTSSNTRSSALKGRTRYDASESLSLSEIPWSSFSTRGSSSMDMMKSSISKVREPSIATSTTSSSELSSDDPMDDPFRSTESNSQRGSDGILVMDNDWSTLR